MKAQAHWDKNGHRLFPIPPWGIELLRITGAVAVALSIGYARFVSLENNQIAIRERVSENRGSITAHDTLISAFDRRMTKSEMHQDDAEKSIADSLKRIEDTVKEVRQDVRDLQKPKK